MLRFSCHLLVATLALFVLRAGQTHSPKLPQGYGLSSRYPGDIGIESDPAVLFAENFERGTLEEIAKRWGNISNKDGKVMSFSNDVPLKVPESVRCK